MTNLHHIPNQNLPVLRYRVDQLNKRARKLGVSELEIVERACFVDGEGMDVEVIGAQVKFEGWEFVGTIEHTGVGNILRAVPGQELPESYRDATSECEHCGTNRSRKNTFVVRHEDGRLMQVGRQCTADFLGHVDPQRLAAMLEMLSELDADADDDERDAASRRIGYSTIDIAERAFAAVRVEGGYRPTNFEASTRSLVFESMSRSEQSPKTAANRGWDGVTDADRKAAREALAWAQAQTDAHGYIANMRVVASMTEVDDKHVGLLVSLPKAMQTAAERAAEDAKRAAEKAEREARKAEAAPAPEGRVEVEGTVGRIKAYENDYGVTYKMFVEADAGWTVLVSVPAAISNVEEGQRVRFTATLTQGNECTFAFGKRPTKAEVLA